MPQETPMGDYPPGPGISTRVVDTEDDVRFTSRLIMDYAKAQADRDMYKASLSVALRRLRQISGKIKWSEELGCYVWMVKAADILESLESAIDREIQSDIANRV
jgi:hypothetical protein